MASIIAAVPIASISPEEWAEAIRRSIANRSVRDVEAEEELAWAQKEWAERARIALETELAWAIYHGQWCPECGGAGEVYIPADTVYPQPAEWAPCPTCNGFGVVQKDGRPFEPLRFERGFGPVPF